MDAHSMIVALKEMAIQLGRTPNRDEFAKSIKNGHKLITKNFGNYVVMVHSAGLDSPRAKKITNEIFETNLVTHLEQYEPKKLSFIAGYPTASIISDIHWPFSNNRVVNRFQEYVGDTKPEFVIINGDAWDFYSHSKFPRSHNVFTPREEQSLSRTMNEDFWKKIKEKSPDSKCIQMLGNHDVRPMKRILEEYPEAEDWIKEKLKVLFTFDGVTTIHDIREELFLNDNTIVFHGYRTKLGDHRDYTLYNTFNGHSHVGGVVYRKIRGQTLWECNSGLAGDPESKGLTYTPQKITNWTPGFASLDKLGARFIHL